MTTSDGYNCAQRRKRQARGSALGHAVVATMIAGGVAAQPALAADFTVTSSAELIQAIEDANAAQGIDTITIDGSILLEADLPQSPMPWSYRARTVR